MYSSEIQYIYPNKQRYTITNINKKSETANPEEIQRHDQLITRPVTPVSEKQQNGTYIKKHGTFCKYLPALYSNIENINQSLANTLVRKNIGYPHVSKRPDTLEIQRSKALIGPHHDYKVVQNPHQPPDFGNKLILEIGPKQTNRTTDLLLMEKINLIRNSLHYDIKKTNNEKQTAEKTQHLKRRQDDDNESPKKVIINTNMKSPQFQRNNTLDQDKNTKKQENYTNRQNGKKLQKHNSSKDTNSKENNMKNGPKVKSMDNINNTDKQQCNKTAQNGKNKKNLNNSRNITAKVSSTKIVQNMQSKKNIPQNVENIKDKNSVQNTDKEQANTNLQKEKKTQNKRNNSLIKENGSNNKSKAPHPEGPNIQNVQNNAQKKKLIEENTKNEKKEENINNSNKQDSGKQSDQTPQTKQNITNTKKSINAPSGNQKSIKKNSLESENGNINKSKVLYPEGQTIENPQNCEKQTNQIPDNKQNITIAKNPVNGPNDNKKCLSNQNNSLIKESGNNNKSKVPHSEGQNIQNPQNSGKQSIPSNKQNTANVKNSINGNQKSMTNQNNSLIKESVNNNKSQVSHPEGLNIENAQNSGKQSNQIPSNKQNTANAKNSINAPNGNKKSMSNQNNSLIKESGNNNKSQVSHPEGQNIQNPQNSGKKSNQTSQNKQNTTNTKNSVNTPIDNQKSISKNTPNTNNSQNSTPNKNKNPNTQIQSELTNEGTTKNSSEKNTNNQITEIYKCNKEKFTGSSENLNDDSTSLQKVTQDLTKIIKNLQKQIQEVPLSNKSSNMEEVPSALMKTKTKEFFKKPTPKQNANSKTSQTTQKTSVNTKTPSKSSTSNSKQSSLLTSTSNNQTKTSNNSIRSYSNSRSSSTSSSASFASSYTDSMIMNSSTSRRGLLKSSFQNVDPVKVLKEDVQRAIRTHKTFTVRGFFYSIRRALRRRGWIEKFHLTHNMTNDDTIKRYQKSSINELVPLLRKPEVAEQCKDLIKSKLLGAYQVDFYWAINVDEAFRENPDKIKLTIINKLKRDIFSYTNKQGLCDASKDSYWYQKKNVSKLNHPRSYSLAAKTGDVKGFIEDFRITAAMSLLKWIIKTSITKESKLISPSGKIPLEVFDFTINECCKFIKKRKHEDIDTTIPEASEKEWNTFLDYFYKIIHYSNHFAEEKRENEESLVRKSNYVINTLREVWPYTDMDGMMNIWIMKPVASSRGRGIHMCRTLQYALKVLKENNNVRYIIQKYIERPLLIHNTKFDIRQWFLISNCSPLTIWIYKHCYLRFSSQTYNLRKLHESIHLTNNSVQCKYRNNFIDTALPSYNMWDSNQFKTYLANIGYPNAYKNIIYPGMKQCITAAVLMHQDKMVIRKNCFELYGADFILTEDFQPWLLEINSNPALQPSTPVTSRMCPRVLEDVIKVIIDYSRNVKADTGGFELMYKQQIIKLPAPAKLEVTGKPLNKNYFNPSPDERKQTTSKKLDIITPDKKQENLKNFTEEIKKTLKNLLNIIHEERLKRELHGKKEKCGSPFPTKMGNKQIKT